MTAAPASRDLRPWMAGLFGLVHGFGFASVLREFGLPREALGWSLFGFNLGVELGQLGFVLPVAAAAGRGAPPLGARRLTVGNGRLCSRRAGWRVLVRPTRVLPWEWSMSRTAVLSGIVLAGVLAVAGRGLVAQQPAATGPNVAGIEKVKDNLYMVTGGGGNTAVFVTANGVVLVDTKLANWGQAIMDQVKTVTDKPVTHIINTHTHGDHVGSNEYFPASVEIVAHANVSTSMAKMPAFADGTKKHAFPDRTYTDRMTVLSGNDAIDLYYFGPAHTNGDTFVVFRNLRVMHSGDAFSAKGAPLLDVNNGGSGVTYPDTIAKVIAGVKNVDTVIPGHSTVMTWQDFGEFGEFTRAFLTAVQTAKKAGKTADQAAAELALPDKFNAYVMTRAKDNVATIYKQLP